MAQREEEDTMKTKSQRQKDYYYRHLEMLRKKNRIGKQKWRKDNPVEARLQDKVKAKKYAEKRKAHSKLYAKTYKKDPLKVAAITILNNAVKLGKIKRPIKCQKCKEKKKVQAHHHDYLKPLEVMWLCKKCHELEHHPY